MYTCKSKNMTDDYIHDSLWWRSEKYVILQGVIRPTRRAETRPYRPWEAFERVRGKYRTVPTLWGELAETVRRINRIRTQGLPEQESSIQVEALILAWTRNHGLLGVMPWRVRSIMLPPTYERAGNYFPKNEVPSGRCIVQKHHRNIGGKWVTTEQATGDSREIDPGRRWEPGQSLALAERRSAKTPVTHFWSWDDNAWTSSKENRVLEFFFRRRPPNGQWPRPLTKQFWADYQEPIGGWLEAAQMFSESVELVSQNAEAYNQEGFTTGADAANRALWLLSAIASDEAYHYEFGQQRVERVSRCSSLLSAMANMFWLDLTAGRRLIRCRNCQTIFVSNDRRASYCTNKCRHAALMRRYRRNRDSKATDT